MRNLVLNAQAKKLEAIASNALVSLLKSDREGVGLEASPPTCAIHSSTPRTVLTSAFKLLVSGEGRHGLLLLW